MTFPQLSITLTRYREPDWLVDEALNSLAAQEGISGEIIFLDQDWNEAFAQKVEARSSERLRFYCVACEERCLSYARNEGLRRARHDLVLFTEPDALAEPDWARRLADELLNGAAIAGSRILPCWRGRPPLLARAKVVQDQYSLFDLGDAVKKTDGPVRALFGLRISAAPTEMRFDENLGRRNGVLIGGEETDLCARIHKAGGEIIYCGNSLVYHQIFPERLSAAWIFKRLYFAGVSRRKRGGAPAPSRNPGFWDWLFMPIILPPYAAGYFAKHL